MDIKQAAQAIFDIAVTRTFNTEQFEKIIEATVPKAPYHIPGPYEIALAVGAALVTTGKYDTPGAALDAAWMAVPEYFTGRDRYLTEMVPMMAAMQANAGQVSELPEWAHDPRADVPGGEERMVGDTGHLDT